VAARDFHIHAVATVDEAMELLTGRPAGEPDAEGNYPDGTVNAAVARRLGEFAEAQRKYSAPDRGGGPGG